MRVAIIQFGDFREGYERLNAGGGETYYAQRYSVDYVVRLARHAGFVGVCGMLGEKSYETELEPGLSTACVPLRNGRVDVGRTTAILDRWEPDRLILQTPEPGILAWSLRRKIPLLPLFADSWHLAGLRSRITAFRLARLLNSPQIKVVGNHNVPASLSLRAIGVDPGKICPWDWPHDLAPDDYPSKELRMAPVRLVFVGAMIAEKGPGECIRATSLLKERGIDIRLSLIGGGAFIRPASQLVKALGLSENVEIAGPASHDEVLQALAAASLSLVLSHHSYSEGLPMTIYEALATRTPLVLSDHPMFRRFFSATPAARMVPEKSPEAVAEAVLAFLADAQAYADASEATCGLWNKIKCDLSWGDLIDIWLEDPAKAQCRLAKDALGAALAQEVK